jgi:hypothetical protein
MLSFEDKQAIEYFSVSWGRLVKNHLTQTLTALKTMIGRTYATDQCASALITHSVYFTLLGKLLELFSNVCEQSDARHFWVT